ncbi:MAG: hypothetical protein ACXWQQ_14490 [Pseudobdellovibrio sp.]
MKINKTLKIYIFSMLGFMYLSGLTQWLLKTYFQVDHGFGPEEHPAFIWVLRFHGTLSLGVLMLFGYIFKAHVLTSLRIRRHVKSGLTLTVYCCLIVLTLPFLMYLTDEDLKSKVELIHTYLGLLLIVPFIIHMLAKKLKYD